jgi:UrcA family protein
MFYRSTTSSKLFLGAALAGLIASAAPFTAQADEWERASIKVPAGDLDLRTQSGAAVLRHRVLAAATTVCVRLNPDDAPNTEVFGMCVNKAVHDAAPQVQALVAAAQGAARLASAAGLPQ